ncbi:hypothetical protein PSHT_12778 [Puccinia striiformis]|uniref:Integrase zinc-binding domain-containing protein n=3 Tax=Puccinia striiformis TaxID=27350 RepID=A0A0L0W5U6_9BASI|nr:hypothetical protein PSTG_00172 [Puccinia striiformis f. sp. tritici PST-78]POV99237.1 hypothetical protein PSTT_13903 [Puccinia striiformis]POW00974.1 hypothetical protein PSHT_12778 [Puccinia striiformis]
MHPIPLDPTTSTEDPNGIVSETFCQALHRFLSLHAGCLDIKRVLFLNGCLVIPENLELRLNLISRIHAILGHQDHLKTLTPLCRGYFWPKMNDKVKLSVQTLSNCHPAETPPPVLPTATQAVPSGPETSFNRHKIRLESLPLDRPQLCVCTPTNGGLAHSCPQKQYTSRPMCETIPCALDGSL